LLVHAFWFAGKLAATAFVQADIPLFAKPTWGCPLAQKERQAGWKSLSFPTIACLRCTQARPVLRAHGRTHGRPMASPPLAQGGQTNETVRLFEQAISTNPDVPNPYYGLGTRYAISASIIESSVQLTIA